MGLNDYSLLVEATDAIVAHLQATTVPRTWDADAVELVLFGDPKDAGSCKVRVVASTTDVIKFNGRYLAPLAMMDVSKLPNGDEMLATLTAGMVLVLYGSSGAGKTYGALLVGRRVAAATAVVYCACKSDAVDEALDKRWREERDTVQKKARRDELAFKYVTDMVTVLIPESNRKKPPPGGGNVAERDLVLVLDELGWGPYLVRGIIAQHTELCAAIKELVHCRGEVHIIIAGTGVEGVGHDIGSSTNDYSAFQMRPQLWSELREHVPSSVNKLVDNECSPTGGLIRTLVTNARCAVAFAKAACEWVKVVGGTVTEETMTHAAAQAVQRYRKLNGLNTLDRAELVAVITSAMAAQLSEADEPQLPVDMRRLKVTYGALVDHGVRSADDPNKVTTIVAPPHRPRYEVEPAFEAMLRLIIGMPNRPPSGEGFEQAFADFAALALTFAGLPAQDGTPPRDLFSDGSVRKMLAHCEVGDGDAVPHGWSAPLTLVSWLREHALGGGRSVGVETHQATLKIEPDTHDDIGRSKQANDDIRKMFETIIRGSNPDYPASEPVANIPRTNALVAINAGQAKWADTFVNAPGSRGAAAPSTIKDLFIMCQEKLLLSATLRQHDLLFELHKMGCTAEIVLAGAWAHEVDSKDVGGLTTSDGRPIASGASVQREALVQVIATALSKGTTFAAWLNANVPKIAKAVVAAQGEKCTKQAALTAAVARGLGAGTTADDVDVAFVVAVFGNAAPLSQQVRALLPRTVLLLHAPAPTSSPGASSQTAAEAQHQGRRLRGFYPVRVQHAGTAVQLCDVPVPKVPERK